MTRYLCVDPSHTLGGEPAAIDLTAQVRRKRDPQCGKSFNLQ